MLGTISVEQNIRTDSLQDLRNTREAAQSTVCTARKSHQVDNSMSTTWFSMIELHTVVELSSQFPTGSSFSDLGALAKVATNSSQKWLRELDWNAESYFTNSI